MKQILLRIVLILGYIIGMICYLLLFFPSMLEFIIGTIICSILTKKHYNDFSHNKVSFEFLGKLGEYPFVKIFELECYLEKKDLL